MKPVSEVGNHLTFRFLSSWIQVLLPWESEGASTSEEKRKPSDVPKLNGEDAWQSCYEICAGDILPTRPVHPSVGGWKN